MRKLLEMVHSAILYIDKKAARLRGHSTLTELNNRIDVAQAEVDESRQRAVAADAEIRQAKQYRRENHLVELVRDVFGDVK